ncbi:MAG: FAD-dependent oxidoreductase, partial [Deltaproteobacteria bacterium]|nr:FAD-dependent oxidoreductase [Deltaproteobacteria bacterium]
QERAFSNSKIEFIWDTVPTRVLGRANVEGLSLKHVKSGKEKTLEVEGIFIFVGTRPATGFLNGSLELDAEGFIKVNRRQASSMTGVFAAGDVTSEAFRQIATAVGEGASAALHAEKYLDAQNG